MNAISIAGLEKTYGEQKAIRGITFDVGHGEIFGLIGPDGAGKTSTFHVLAGVMEATRGTATVFGRPARDARADTGYLTQAFSLYPDLSVMENIRYTASLRRVDARQFAARAKRYLRLFDLDRFADRLVGRLSGGMKQKLALACALVPEPRVLLLDEPTTGVDPVSRREFWDVLSQLATGGLTVLVATPYLDEAERCQRVALMHLGEIRQVGSPSELRQRLHATRLELQTPRLAAAERVLSRTAGPSQPLLDVQRFGDRLDLLTHDERAGRESLMETMRANGLSVVDVRADEPTLENTFVATLRQLGHEMAETPFPSRKQHERLHDGFALDGRHLTKRYGDFIAVDNVSVQIRFGEIYGLLGANGAGKTTTIKMLCGLLDPTSGIVELSGERSNVQLPASRQRIGYMSQKFSLYDDLTVAENLDFFAGVYGVPRDERDEKREWVLAFAGLSGKQHVLTRTLPGGWKQRVAFGSAIMHEPSVLFLDEPTSGVDPLARRAFWRMINHLADAGTAVLVTTHFLEEAEQCNRLGLMAAGALVVEGSPREIKSRQSGALIEFIVDQPQDAANVLRSTGERWRVSLFGDRLHVMTDDDAEATRATVEHRLVAHGISVRRSRRASFSLEDVFIRIVEERRGAGAQLQVDA
jgi:ABC-2 type transport system ATP-binding protein